MAREKFTEQRNGRRPQRQIERNEINIESTEQRNGRRPQQQYDKIADKDKSTEQRNGRRPQQRHFRHLGTVSLPNREMAVDPNLF